MITRILVTHVTKILFYTKQSNTIMGQRENKPDSKDFLDVKGTIVELLPSAQFKVELESGQDIQAYLSGRMRMHKIRLLPGDKVQIEMSPYDLTRGRITYRY